MKLSDIKNLPDYAKDYKYIVYNHVEHENWFYGAYNSAEKASSVAAENREYTESHVFVNKENNKAHWEVCGMFDDFVRCSKCHEHKMPMSNLEYYKFNYCPNCGAEME